MIEIYDEYDFSLDGGHFSTYKKNLGNKLFIYAGCRIIADLLNYDLISPENALVRRENNETGTYEDQIFPFKSVLGRQRIDNPTKVISDHDIIALQSIDNLIKNYPNHKFVNQCYFSKYDYIKPYKNMVKNYYESLVQPKRTTNDIVLMLRNSRIDGSFVLPDEYYLNILEKETFDNLYISLDHVDKHQSLLNKLQKYNPKFINGKILEVFSEITSFNKIIAAQGTFSFWACFLSNAEKIYWPITNDGPNSGKNSDKAVFKDYVNLIVDDEPRYEFINVPNIYQR
jgi:hypothetical protein